MSGGIPAPGRKVWANLGGEQDYIGFVVSEKFLVDGETKYKVAIGTDIRTLGYREPADREGGGKGVTFWLA